MADPEHVKITAQRGNQERFLSTAANIAIYGGSAGCGKTFALLLEPLRHRDNRHFSCVTFRRESPEITNPGGLWDESEKLYPLVGATPNASRMEWALPSGATIKFAHMQYEDDKLAWKGAQVTLISFDQLESFTEGQFWYMVSRNRDARSGITPYMRATANPVPEDDPVGGWLHKLISWWLDEDTGLPRADRGGKLRWFVRYQEQLEWFDAPGPALARMRAIGVTEPDARPLSLTFIPGRLDDNPALTTADPGYRMRLLSLPPVERERLLGGNWKVRPTAGAVFDRAWFGVVDAVPTDCRWVRYWDKAGTEAGGKFTVGVKMGYSPSTRLYYVAHVVRGQWGAANRTRAMHQTAEADGFDVPIWVEQEPGSGGKESAQLTVEDLAGWAIRAEPVTGDKVTRAGPLSAQACAGNVKLLRGEWNEPYLAELHGFPEGVYSDQVDASSGAFNKLALGSPIVIGELGAGSQDPIPPTTFVD